MKTKPFTAIPFQDVQLGTRVMLASGTIGKVTARDGNGQEIIIRNEASDLATGWLPAINVVEILPALPEDATNAE